MPTKKPAKKYEIKILWGERPEKGTKPTRYAFKTQHELAAFLSGVDAACGWMAYDYRTPEDKGYRTYKATEED